ncbi:MAG: hypothetical protein RSB05_01530 [Clostridiales bacterium]
MNQIEKEYLQSLIPKDLPNWQDIAKEGYAIGKAIKVVPSLALKNSGYKSEVDMRLDKAAQGKITWRTIMGLATLKDQKEGLEYLEEFANKTGVVIDAAMIIPNMLTGIPDEKRKNVPKGTSFILEKSEDWQLLSQSSHIHTAFCDFHIGSANASFNTENALKADSSYSGIFSQFVWDYPNCNDDIANLCDNLKAISMVAAKYDEKFVVDTYMDDGLPSYFLDLASFLGYAKLEKYIVSTLCGARYACSFGQLMDETVPKVALWLGLSQVLKEKDQPGVSFVFSNCIDHWDHDLEANYGVLCTELLLEILAEKKYKTGASILPIPITEKVAVPTPEGIANIHAGARRVEEKAEEWRDLIDFSKIEKIRDILVTQGSKFFENILDGFKTAGIDIENPLELMVVLKRINPGALEEMFHPSLCHSGDHIKPYVPTSMARRSMAECEEIIVKVKKFPDIEKLKNTEILVLSGDVHRYGIFVLSGVLNGLGVKVVEGGVGMEPVETLDIADEENITKICVSVHNGQGLDYAKQLEYLGKDRGKEYSIYMGGKLNGIIGEESEPQDVSALIAKTGVIPCETVEEFIAGLLE